MTPAAPRPGWYPDPAGNQLFRWWDGADWTEATSESAAVPPPVLAVIATTPEQPRGRAHPLRRVLVITVGLAMFLTASAGFGLILWQEPPRRPASPASGTTGGATTGATGRLDERTRNATIDDASMVLPADPYRLEPRPVELAGVFDLAFYADAVVHPRYDGRQHWTATVLLARPARAAQRSDPSAQAELTLQQLRRVLFEGHATEVRDAAVTDRAVDGHPGALLTASVHYAVSGLPSRFDAVTALVVRLDDGAYVLAASVVPNDADPAVAAQAAAALDSLAIG